MVEYVNGPSVTLAVSAGILGARANGGLLSNICLVWLGSHCPMFHPLLAEGAHTEEESGESAF